jgi:hypothetical protein
MSAVEFGRFTNLAPHEPLLYVLKTPMPSLVRRFSNEPLTKRGRKILLMPGPSWTLTIHGFNKNLTNESFSEKLMGDRKLMSQYNTGFLHGTSTHRKENDL